MAAATGPGTGTRLSEQEGRVLWTIAWQSAQIVYSAEKDFGGSMQKVSGQIYSRGKPASYFVADSAEADRKTERLVLIGNVKVTALKNGAVLRCDRIEWLPSRKLIAARGNITFDTGRFLAGTFNEILATPDLLEAGTPEQFAGR